jgi:K+-sensing histidine kinase KdpD
MQSMSHVEYVRARFAAPAPSLATGVPLAILAAAVPALIRLAVNPVVTDATFPTFYPFILAAAMFVGWRYATLATLLSALAANYFFVPPANAFTVTDTAIGGGLLFIGTAAAMIYAVEWLRSTLPDADVRPATQRHAQAAAVGRPMPIGVPLAIAALVSLGLWAGLAWVAWAALKLIG